MIGAVTLLFLMLAVCWSIATKLEAMKGAAFMSRCVKFLLKMLVLCGLIIMFVFVVRPEQVILHAALCGLLCLVQLSPMLDWYNDAHAGQMCAQHGSKDFPAHWKNSNASNAGELSETHAADSDCNHVFAEVLVSSDCACAVC